MQRIKLLLILLVFSLSLVGCSGDKDKTINKDEVVEEEKDVVVDEEKEEIKDEVVEEEKEDEKEDVEAPIADVTVEDIKFQIILKADTMLDAEHLEGRELTYTTFRLTNNTDKSLDVGIRFKINYDIANEYDEVTAYDLILPLNDEGNAYVYENCKKGGYSGYYALAPNESKEIFVAHFNDSHDAYLYEDKSIPFQDMERVVVELESENLNSIEVDSIIVNEVTDVVYVDASKQLDKFNIVTVDNSKEAGNIVRFTKTLQHTFTNETDEKIRKVGFNYRSIINGLESNKAYTFGVDYLNTGAEKFEERGVIDFKSEEPTVELKPLLLYYIIEGNQY